MIIINIYQILKNTFHLPEQIVLFLRLCLLQRTQSVPKDTGVDLSVTH